MQLSSRQGELKVLEASQIAGLAFELHSPEHETTPWPLPMRSPMTSCVGRTSQSSTKTPPNAPVAMKGSPIDVGHPRFAQSHHLKALVSSRTLTSDLLQLLEKGISFSSQAGCLGLDDGLHTRYRVLEVQLHVLRRISPVVVMSLVECVFVDKANCPNCGSQPYQAGISHS